MHPPVTRALTLRKYDVSVQVLYYCFVMGLGICPLIGTTSSSLEYMNQDLPTATVLLTFTPKSSIVSSLIRQRGSSRDKKDNKFLISMVFRHLRVLDTTIRSMAGEVPQPQ